MAGYSVNVTRNNPCKICGKPDGCDMITYPDGSVVWACRRIHGTKGSTTIGKDGRTYVGLRETSTGIFFKWQEQLEYTENLKRFLEEKGIRKRDNVPNKKPMIKKPIVEPTKEPETPLLPPDKLDEIYRYFMSILILEKRHKEILLKEWKKVPGLFEAIQGTYLIKSLPPADTVRFSMGSEHLYENLTRKEIMKRLLLKYPDLTGVPGFYQFEDGTWTFSYLSGILYPSYDVNGRVIRLRVADDFPLVRGQYEGKTGNYFFSNGKWFFQEKGEEKEEEETTKGKKEDSEFIVYSYRDKRIRKISLNQKGLPEGKPQGKYKWFSSHKLILSSDGVYRNKYKNGSSSGCVISYYSKPGDNLSMVYFTEGEKKGMVANMLLNIPVVHIPGTSNFGVVFYESEENLSVLHALKEQGMEIAVMAYDADKTINATVLRDERGAVNAFKESGTRIALSEWNIHWGKGLDDCLLEGVRPELYMVE